MGYRHYFYKIPKKVVKEIENKTYDELFEKYASENDREDFEKYQEKYFDFDNLGQECIFNFGKLYWEDTAEKIYDTGKPLFKNKDTQSQFEDYMPYIVTKEAIKIAIEVYKNKIVNYYEDLFKDNKKILDPFVHMKIAEIDVDFREKCIEHCRNAFREWKSGIAINLNEDDENITDSWFYEYEIFELVRIYKTFDFTKYDLLFYGY